VRASLNGELVERDVDDSGDGALRLSNKGSIISRRWLELETDVRDVLSYDRSQGERRRLRKSREVQD
jgi:hypothetical protein